MAAALVGHARRAVAQARTRRFMTVAFLTGIIVGLLVGMVMGFLAADLLGVE